MQIMQNVQTMQGIETMQIMQIMQEGTNSDRCQRQKQGAVSGSVAEALPAAEAAEAELGPPSKFASALRA